MPLCFAVFRICRKPCRTGVWLGRDRLAPTIERVPYRTGTNERSTQRKKRTKAEITQSPCVRDGGECDFVKLTLDVDARARHDDRLTTIRLRMLIGRELEDRGISTSAAIGDALGIPAAEATKLLTRHQWREGDVALLEAAAARLGVRS